MKKTGGKASYKKQAVRKKTAVKRVKVKSKRAAKRSSGYNPQTGRLTGRAISAQARLEKRAEVLMGTEGLSASEARQRAREEMRSNPKMDWRRG